MTAAMAVAVTACAGGDPTPDSSTDVPSTTAIAAAECGSLEDAITAVTSSHPEVGLAVGSVPTDDQIAALRDLVEGLDAVDLTDSDLKDVRQAMIVASQSIIDRGGAQQPITDADQGAFAGALTAASSYCGALTGAPSAPPPADQSTSPGSTAPGTTAPVVPPATASGAPPVSQTAT